MLIFVRKKDSFGEPTSTTKKTAENGIILQIGNVCFFSPL